MIDSGYEIGHCVHGKPQIECRYCRVNLTNPLPPSKRTYTCGCEMAGDNVHAHCPLHDEPSVGQPIPEATLSDATSAERSLKIIADYYRHYRSVVNAGKSEFIKENGRYGKSAWSELMDAIDEAIREEATK